MKLDPAHGAASHLIEVVKSASGRMVYAYIGKFSPYSIGLPIGEIIKGLPDEQAARMVLTDIMATLAKYEDTELTPSEIVCLSDRVLELEDLNEELTAELARYKKAEQEGRIVVLPVAIGSVFYALAEFEELDGTIIKSVEELYLTGYINELGKEFYTAYYEEVGGSTADINIKDAFLTREEAEEALKKMEV